ncbi:MAG: hypothetical protein ABJC88_16765 [Parasphingorhabdus sp.]|uniref:hypothetical protein n=1 Tax=Sphingomonadales TaxID=204457 RepID=UPI0032643599
MKVKLLVALAGVKSYSAGDEYECTADEAERFFKSGIAEKPAAKVERAVKKNTKKESR